jgi:hypothetical protein
VLAQDPLQGAPRNQRHVSAENEEIPGKISPNCLGTANGIAGSPLARLQNPCDLAIPAYLSDLIRAVTDNDNDLLRV